MIQIEKVDEKRSFTQTPTQLNSPSPDFFRQQTFPLVVHPTVHATTTWQRVRRGKRRAGAGRRGGAVVCGASKRWESTQLTTNSRKCSCWRPSGKTLSEGCAARTRPALAPRTRALRTSPSCGPRSTGVKTQHPTQSAQQGQAQCLFNSRFQISGRILI